MSSATSTIEIYKSCKLLKDKNFVLDGSSAGIDYVSSYLGTLTKKTITGFQYIKHALAITIKVDLNQDYFQMKESQNDWNYVKIRNSGLNDRNFYYFVDHFEWASENTAKIYLMMDTANTFKYNVDYKVDKKTLVKRRHEDRFIDYTEHKFDIYFKINKTDPLNQTIRVFNILATQYASHCVIDSWNKIAYESTSNANILSVSTSNGYIAVQTGTGSLGTISMHVKVYIDDVYGLLLKKIDFKSEQINTPVYKTTEEELRENIGEEITQWKLLYRNDSSDSVGCYLIPNSTISVEAMNNYRQLLATAFANDGYYYHFVTYESSATAFIVGDKKAYSIQGLSSNQWIVIHKSGGDLTISRFGEKNNTIIGSNLSSIDVDTLDSIVYFRYSATSLSYGSLATYEYPNSWNVSATITKVSSNYDLDNIVDKSLSTNIKLINLPYAPNNLNTFNSVGILVVGEPWIYDTTEHMLKYNALDRGFNNEIDTEVKGIYTRLMLMKSPYDLSGDALRFFEDPKLLHSDFHRLKFVYDSFAKEFPYELLDFNPSASWDFRFNFKVSRNITSKFLFTFGEIVWKMSGEDYPNILVVARNNEEVLYSSQYLDYLRNGFNFDMKAKQRQEETGLVGMGLSAGSLVASLLLSSNPVGALAVATAGIGLATQYVNYAKMQAENEANIERKLQETKSQAISVFNNDDFDLFEAYSNNKAKICEYEVSENMKKVLDDLFYYAGYSVNKQMIPNVSSRYWFNFLQASLEVSETNNISEECMNDIKERFEQGVTFLHFHNGFDFGQVKENLEVDLVTS